MEKIKPTDIRQSARVALEGSWGASAVVALVYMLMIVCFEIFANVLTNSEFAKSTVYLILVLAAVPVSIALNFTFQDLLRSSVKPEPKALLSLMDEYARYLISGLLVAVYTCLWMLLLIVPGLIKSMSYAMTFYIMRDNPEMKPSEAIDCSQKMMNGHKMELFLLELSFIGWILLSMLTLGIGMIWLLPYISTSTAVFYERVKDGNTIID